ncbi:hypothetical protein K1X76_12425 [bacterium]|nr:hypothetical protein [bacterium]
MTNSYSFKQIVSKSRKISSFLVYGGIVLIIAFVNVVGVMGVLQKMNDPIPRTRIPEVYVLEVIFILMSIVLAFMIVALTKNVKVWFDDNFLYYRVLFTHRVALQKIEKVDLVKRIYRYRNSKTIMYDTRLFLVGGKTKSIISHRVDEIAYAQQTAGIIWKEICEKQQHTERTSSF